jgi:hypothetical protein
LKEKTVTANPGACLPRPDGFEDIALDGSNDISMSASGVINNRASHSSVLVDGKSYDVFVYSHQFQDNRIKQDVSPLIIALWSESASERKRAKNVWSEVIESVDRLPVDCSTTEVLAGDCKKPK